VANFIPEMKALTKQTLRMIYDIFVENERFYF